MKDIYVDTFHELVPVSMGQILEELYNFLGIREPEDLKLSTQSTTDAREAKWTVFVKSYKACFHVYVPTVDRLYLAIRCKMS